MSGLALKIYDVPVISLPAGQEVEEFCRCDFVCEYEEIVFAKSDGSYWQQDITSFLTRKISSADTIEIKLLRYGAEVATITDNTFGTLYQAGDFTAQPLYVGWIADWTLIYDALRGGQYQVQIDKTIAGVASTFMSRKFRLREYDAMAAHRTVRVETMQTGNILSSPFDFTDLLPGGWPQSMRFKGHFGDKTPQLETDRFLDTSYNEVQNRDQVRFEYTLSLEDTPQNIFNEFSEREILANTLLVTDYDVMNPAVYRRVPVVIDSLAAATFFPNGRGRFSFTCSDRTKDTIKRNF